MSAAKADSEGWIVFLCRRIVLEVSSPDCNQNRTGLVKTGRQGKRVVTDGWQRRGGRRIDDRPSSPYCTVLQRSCVVMRL